MQYNIVNLLVGSITDPEMNYPQHRQPSPNYLEQKPFYNPNHRIVTYPTSLNVQQQKINFNYQQQNGSQSIVPQPINNYNYPHNYLQNNTLQPVNYARPTEILPKQTKTTETINTKGVVSQSTVDKRFMPLSSEKVQKQKQDKIGYKIDHQGYAKSTILTVLIGFLLLSVIIGIFYGIIQWDKAHSAAQPVTVSAGKSTESVSEGEWKTLPEDEGSPLEFLEDFQTSGENVAHKEQKSSMQIKSHKLFTQMRKHIQ